ncbi:MAG: TonB-dependent receptor [Alphaproteobacteria bacterium]|nr:TonB-dependent receptor [Alphaproteobacteria bacterium]MDE2012645.1 TonB-dependent receptor [Alphaproteobacteria bacterium]MDE2072126.1 TonB-dependent receptor [Alphaproteobacteria bacterium]
MIAQKMNCRLAILLGGTAFSTIALAAPMAAHAQSAAAAASGQIEEVVVTAQKRVQNIQDVGIAITAISGDQLAARGITSTDALAGVPGVYISSFNSDTTTTLTIRGVNQNDFGDQEEPPNAVYVDGAYVSFIGGAGFSMYDVQRVEVLRGPQGTLFGRNATGGLMQVITKKPTEDFEGYVRANFGERNLWNVEGAVSGPLSDNLLGRLSVSTDQSDGYIKNTLGGPALQGANNVSGRLQLEYKPKDNVDILLKIHGGRDDVKGSIAYDTKHAVIGPNGMVSLASSNAQYAAFCAAQFFGAVPTGNSDCAGAVNPAPNNPYVTALDNPGFMKRDVYGTTLSTTIDLSDSIQLVSVTDYLKLKRNSSEDTDGTRLRLFNFFSNMDSDQFSEDLRVQGHSEAWDWVGGLYYITINHHILTGIDGMPDAYTLANANPNVLFPFYTKNAVHQTTDSWAVYGQGEWRFAENWSAIVGARWSDDNKKININPSCTDMPAILPACAIGIALPGTVQGDGYSGKRNDGMYSLKFGLNFHPEKDWLIYATASRGTKGGGFNAGAIAGIPESAESYKPETLWAYETGVKSTILGGTTDIDGDVFYYDYANYQAFTLTGLTPTVFNVNANVKGAELEVRTRPIAGLSITASAAYLDAVAHHVPSNLLGTGVDLGDQRIPQSPPWSFSIAGSYTWNTLGGYMTVSSDAEYTGRRYFNTVNHPALQNGAYTIVNASISYSPGDDDRWQFSLWGKNLSNTEFASTGFDLTTTNGVETYTVSPPRWFGGSIAYKW